MCATSNDRPPGSTSGSSGNSGSGSGSGFLPEGAERCVWMTAGLVAYKLCDHAFECEACPFDAVMRGQAAVADATAADATASDPAPLLAAPCDFPADRRYHPAHTWAAAAGPDRVRVGLDAFAARLASQTTSVVLPPPGSSLARGRAGAWLVDESGPIPLRMPVTGPVLRQNALLRTHPRLAVESPYGDGWLVEVGWRELVAREMDELMTAAEMRRRVARQLEQLEAGAAAEHRHGREVVGPTLPDGGEPLLDLRAVLGPSRYCRLVIQLLA